ncbi:MAG: hypothetical protein AAGA99_27385 [Actinomycetota bacterium]
MSTWSDIRARKQARQTEVVLALDDDPALDELDRARGALRAAEARSARQPSEEGTAAVESARSALDAARAIAEEHVVRFAVRSIGRAAYGEILAEYPAEEGKGDEGAEQAAQMVAACVVEPAFSVEEARQFLTDPEWSRGEVLQVVQACHHVNSEARKVDLGNS